MFDGLKKKFSSFVQGLAKKEKEEAHAEAEIPASGERREERTETVVEPKAQAKEEKREARQEDVEARPAAKVEKNAEEARAAVSLKPKVAPKEDVLVPRVETEKKERQVKPSVHVEEPRHEPVQTAKQAHAPIAEPKEAKPKVTFTTRLKSVIFSQVKIKEADADPFIESLKIGLLQSDVNYDVAERMTEDIRKALVGRAVESRNIEGEITNAIRESIMKVLASAPEIDIVKMVNSRKEAGQLPFKIMFIGPNGAGKTTTMAKIANMLLSNNITCVFSASDTFRAAAIEQTIYHAGKLGINVIKGSYGADPASVAFDAIAHAKAHGIMAVLIDSAGRQETNKSLIDELRKMVRVTAPDLKIFVGEAISGNALLDQVKAINEAVKIDGIILTKLDVDAKGGNTLSILSDTTVPVLFFGTGEKYSDIMKYEPKFIIDNILP